MQTIKEQAANLIFALIGAVVLCFIFFHGIQCSIRTSELEKELKQIYVERTGIQPEALRIDGSNNQSLIR